MHIYVVTTTENVDGYSMYPSKACRYSLRGATEGTQTVNEIPLGYWGKRHIQLRMPVIAALNAAPLFVKDVLWVSLVAGLSSSPVHAGTHREGFAADFELHNGHWNEEIANEVKDFLATDFAVAFRCGAGEYSTGDHLHIAFKGYSNSAKIIAANNANPYRNHKAIELIFSHHPG